MEDQEFEDGGELSEVSVEERARAMGWKPQHEYRGDPRRWTDAAEFIAHGEAALPILRDQSRKMSEKLARQETDMSKLREEMAEQAAAVKHAMDLARNANDAGYKRAMDELKAKQREAVAVGDTETYDNVDAQIKAAEAERATANITVPIPKAPEVPKAPQMDRETTDFIADNPWFNDKPILNAAMVSAHLAIVKREGAAKGADLTDQYERAKAEVVEAFPQYFPNEDDVSNESPQRPRPRLRAAPLSPSSSSNQPRRNGSPFDRIEDPAEREEAKKAFAGLAKYDPDCTANEYVTLYLNPKADVLALRASRNKAH